MSGAPTWTHDDLALDLARTRQECGEIVADNLTLGPAGGPRADVVSMKPSWTNPNPVVWEVKVSRSDFLSDTGAGKFMSYLQYCERLYFATPTGLLTKDEIPTGCGLTVRGENGWHTVKAPRLRLVEDDDMRELERALLLRSVDAPWRRHNGREGRLERLGQVKHWKRLRELTRYGRKFSRQVHAAMEQAGEVDAELENAKSTLRQALGLRWGEEGDLTLVELADRLVEAHAPVVPPDLTRGLRAALTTIDRGVQAARQAADLREA